MVSFACLLGWSLSLFLFLFSKPKKKNRACVPQMDSLCWMQSQSQNQIEKCVRVWCCVCVCVCVQANVSKMLFVYFEAAQFGWIELNWAQVNETPMKRKEHLSINCNIGPCVSLEFPSMRDANIHHTLNTLSVECLAFLGHTKRSQ